MGTIKLDKFDRAILRELQKDASRSTSEIASIVGLSQSPCWKRINNLEKLGVIERQVAVIDGEMLGFNVFAFVHAKLEISQSNSLSEFESIIARIPEILSCYTILGSADFLLRICAEDMKHLEKVLVRLWSYPGIRDVTTYMVLKESKPFAGFPI